MTTAEEFLWSKVREDQFNGHRFYRQKPVGIYITDFYCPKAKLVIEIDGGQHFSSEKMEYDKERSKYFSSIGLITVRFTNNEVLTNIQAVLERIEKELA